MSPEKTEQVLGRKLISLFDSHRNHISRYDPPFLQGIRNQAMESFRKAGFPTTAMETWRNTNLERVLEKDYNIIFDPPEAPVDLENVFRCEVPDFNTHIISLYNGWYISRDTPLLTLPNGTIIGSLAQALREIPELAEKHFNKYAGAMGNGLISLNTAFAQDGVFIYVPDGVEAYKTIQMVNILNRDDDVMVQNRNLVILGRNSRLRLVHCDDSHNQQPSFTNTVTEVFLDEGATIDHYKLQNLNNSSTLVNSSFFYLEKESRLSTHLITLNGGLIRNESFVRLSGPEAHADVFGIYLMDKNQHVDNQVFMDHSAPVTTSNQLFKGILDDQASGVFNGHILVRKDAQRISAYQSNRNILLTDKAVVHAKPFLEIYADDVKCSHGATVGRLDENALFYIRSRGIGEYNARLLLMYAFAAEVIRRISITPLRNRIDDLVKKRLRGELAICDQCVLHCSQEEKRYSFDIDMSKI
ncbi:MAG: Fe-S cluster assembly protein SufD [Bacteroidales bacterium]|nr:Fe-S cluster assembly protein SufD [Bacteroidales bacterium]